MIQKISIKSEIPDSINFIFNKEIDKDTIYLWLSKNILDSLEFQLQEIDTIKTLSIKFNRAKDTLIDSLRVSQKTRSIIDLNEKFKLSSNLPINKVSDSLIFIRNIDLSISKHTWRSLF